MRHSLHRVLVVLAQRPGCMNRDVAQDLSITDAAAQQKLKLLRQRGFVRSEGGRGPAGKKNWLTRKGKREAEVPAAPSKGDLVRQLAARNPDASRRKIALELGIAPTTVQYHLSRRP